VVAFGVLIVFGVAATALLAVVLIIARRDRIQLSISLLQACLAFVAILLLGAGAMYVANGGAAVARGTPVLVQVRPGAFGYPWIAGYETPTR